MNEKTSIMPRRAYARRSVGTLSMPLLFASLLLTPVAAWPQAGGAGGGGDEVEVQSLLEMNASVRLPGEGRGRAATPFAGYTTQNDSFFVTLHRFDDLSGACQGRGWIGTDLTGETFAHVDTRVVNDGFVNMNTRAFWFGADWASNPNGTKKWLRSEGYGGGWSQRLTSPAFSRVAHPDAVLRFDAHVNLQRNAGDNYPWPTPLSGGSGNTFLGVQALMQDGTWGFVQTRHFQATDPQDWEQVPPLDGHWSSNGLSGEGTAAVDGDGRVYVVDHNSEVISQLTRTLQFLNALGNANTGAGNGSGPGQLSGPWGVAVDDQDELYVTEAWNNRVQVFDSDGNSLRQWGSLGFGPGQFIYPRGIDVDAAGNVYVVDDAGRVQKFDRLGTYLTEWSVLGGGFYPDLAIGPLGNIYITDRYDNGSIHVFDPSGVSLGTLGGYGSGPGQFYEPYGIDFDAQGYMYVTDYQLNRIQRLRTDGTPLAMWGTSGSGYPNEFFLPGGIAIRDNGEMYIADTGNYRTHRFQIGGPLAGWGTVKQEVHLGADGNENLPLAEPLQLRIVFQTGRALGGAGAESPFPLAGDSQINLVDNLSLTDTLGDVIPPVDFEDGTTGAWTVSAQNGSYTYSAFGATAIRDRLPQSNPVTQSDFDFNDPTCVWTMTSPSGLVDTGALVTIESPWTALPPGTAQYSVRGTQKLNLLEQARFLAVYLFGKNAGDTRPQARFWPGFIYFGGFGQSDLEVPFEPDGIIVTVPDQTGGCCLLDSVKVVLEVWDQFERFKDVPLLNVQIDDPESRPPTRLPFLDDLSIVAYGVDQDYDGVADAYDACPTVSGAGQDSDGDGCPDEAATLRHVESWSADGGPITFQISQQGHPGITDGSDLQAVRDGFATWQGISGSNLSIVEAPVTSQTNASATDGINLVSFVDDFQFPANVLAITPTTSFTQRTTFNDEIVLPGQIVDGDIMFNPSSPLSTTSGGSAGTFDVKSTAVHEIGHFLGLSHSPVVDATMNPVLLSGTEAATLAEDDEASIASAYPDPTLLTNFGRIAGHVTRGGTGLPLPGAMVIAWRVDGVNPDVPAASDYTDENGAYELFRLAPGDYAVRIAPLDGVVPGVVPEAINLRVQEIAEIDFEAEWYGGPESASEDASIRELVPVTIGASTTVDFVTNIDTTPPFVAGMSPPAGSIGVRIDSPLLVTFSEPIDANTLGSAFFLRPLAGGPSLGGGGQLLTPGLAFVFVPSEPLQFDTDYQLEVTTALLDRAGNPMASSFLGTFHTELQPPVSIGNVEPREAPAGAFVTLSGAGYDATPGAANTVYFTNSANQRTAVPGALVTPTSMVAQVPVDAVSGPVTVMTNGQESNAFGFVLLTSSALAPVQNGSPVALPFAPRDVVVAPDGLTAFAAGEGGLVRINLDPNRPDYRMAVTTMVSGIERVTLTPDGLRGFMAAPDAGTVFEFDADFASATYGQVLGQTDLPGSPDGMVVSSNGRRLYANDQVSDRIFEVDIDPGSATYRSLLREIVASGVVLSGGLAFDASGSRLFATTLDRGVVSIDPATGATETVNASASHASAVLTPNGARLLAAGEDDDRSMVLFADVGAGVPPAEGATFLSGYVRDLLVHPAGTTALTVNSVLGSIQVLDIARAAPVQVASVGTGKAPVAIGGSADGSMIAVANFGSRSISIYTMNAAASLVRLTPSTAMPGDMVTAQTDGSSLPADVSVEINGRSVTPERVVGGSLAFRLPSLPQGEAGVALAYADGRSFSLPLRVVDRIDAHFAATTGVSLGPDPAICTGNAAGAMEALRVSPDGSLLAVGRSGAGCALLDLYRVDPSGQMFGERLLDALPLAGLMGVGDIAFTPDGRQAWVAGTAGAVAAVDVQSGSPTFGSAIPFGAAEMGAAHALATDPFGRYVAVSAEPVPGIYAIQLWTPGRTLVQSVPVPGPVGAMTASPDGRWLVAGGDGAAYLVDLDAPSAALVTPSHGAGMPVSAVAVTGDGARAVGVFPGSQIAIWNLDATAGAVGDELFFGAPLPPGFDAGPLAAAPDGGGILIGCPTCASLAKLEMSVLPPTVTTATLAEPVRAMARSEDGRRLFAANWDDATLTGSVRVLNLQGQATRMALISGLDQTAEGGQTLPLPVTVQVIDGLGRPQAGVLVAFELAAGQGAIDGISGPAVVRRVSDLNGEAAVPWTMPQTPALVDMQIAGLGTPIPVKSILAESVLDDALAAPVVLAVGPASGATGIRAGTSVYARFSQRMNLATLGLLLTADGLKVPGAVTGGDENRMVYFTPSQPIPYGAACVFTVLAGASDLEGQVLATGASTQFTVEAMPVLTLSTFSPPAATAGAEVTLIGAGFSTVAAQNIIRFGGLQASVLRNSATSVVVVIPPTVSPGLVDVTAEVGGVTSAPLAYTVLSPDPTALQTVDEISVHSGVQDLAISPDGNRVYVTSPTTNSVLAFQLKPSQFLASIPVGLMPQSIAFIPDGTKAYVANTAGNNVSVIDTDPLSPNYNQVLETGAVRPPIYPIKVGEEPVDVSMSSFGPTVVVLNAGDGTLSLIEADPFDGTKDAVTSSVNLGSGGTDIAITPDGTRAYVATVDGVIEVSLLSKAVTSSINLGSGGTDIAITPDGTVLFALSEHDSLFVIDITPGSDAYNRVTSSINLGSGGTDIAVTPDGALLYVSLPDENAVAVFQIIRSNSGGSGAVVIPGASVTLTHVATVPVGDSPSSVFMSPLGSPVLVINEGSGTISVLEAGGPPPVPVVHLTIAPHKIKVKEDRKMPWVTAYLEPELPYTADQIDVMSLLLDGTLAADLEAPMTVADKDSNGVQELSVKFDYHELIKLATESGLVTFTMTGTIAELPFTAEDQVLVDTGELVNPLALGKVPARLEFSRVQPNPARGSVALTIGLPRDATVALEIFDTQGRRVQTVADARFEAGWHSFSWQGTGQVGQRLGAGIYFARMRAEGKEFKQRIIMLR